MSLLSLVNTLKILYSDITLSDRLSVQCRLFMDALILLFFMCQEEELHFPPMVLGYGMKSYDIEWNDIEALPSLNVFRNQMETYQKETCEYYVIFFM